MNCSPRRYAVSSGPRRPGCGWTFTDLLEAGRHRHHGAADAGLAQRAAAKLAEVEAKITDLTVIAATLRAALAAGCSDLIECAGMPHCPLPFAGLADDTGEGEEVVGDAGPW
ncbi:MAG TPA: hypothetical protein VGA04_04715 [Streptosporangiaceae bacterium]